MGDTSRLDTLRHEAQMIALHKLEEIIDKIGVGGPTLRDRFAMNAPVIDTWDYAGSTPSLAEKARWNYRYADAMLAGTLRCPDLAGVDFSKTCTVLLEKLSD